MNTINIKKTGCRLKELCMEKHLKVSVIQQKLCLSSSQSIYRWFRGETLPSIDHLCVLSEMLELPIEGILVFDENTNPEQHYETMLGYITNKAKNSANYRACFVSSLAILLEVE